MRVNNRRGNESLNVKRLEENNRMNGIYESEVLDIKKQCREIKSK